MCLPFQEKQEVRVRPLSQEDPLEEEVATESSILAWKNSVDKGAWWNTVHRVTESQTQLNTHAHEAVWQDTWYFHDAVGSSLSTHSFNCGWVGFTGYQMKGFGQVSKSPFSCQKKEETLKPRGVLGKPKEQCVKNSCHNTWHIVTVTITVFFSVSVILMVVLSLLLSNTLTCGEKPSWLPPPNVIHMCF